MMNGSIKWSDESTREFIQLRYKLRHLFNGRKHLCEKAYSRIVDELGLTNIITPAQARKKWSNLLQKYMDIKGGYSTANADWPYFQILDQIVPLMRKEKIEKIPPSNVDHRDIDGPQDSLPSPLTTTIVSEQDPLSGNSNHLSATSVNTAITAAQPSNAVGGKCKTEAFDNEPPRKRGRGRRAAQRARDRWWGAVEDEDIASDSTGSAVRGEVVGHPGLCRASTADSMDPSQMELQTFNLLDSCSSALVEIRETLRLHAEQQETIMRSLQQTLANQGSTVKELLSTMTTQNATLIALMTQLTTRNSQSPLGLTVNGSFNEQKQRTESTAHNQSAGPASNFTTKFDQCFSQDTQDCENPLVETSELADGMTGL